jgi:GcrA cell cycle regulator
MAWNDERTELLKALWADGLSASQIAAELGGVTRNSVIGKVHRLHLTGRIKRVLNPRAPRPARSSTSTFRRPTIRGLFNTINGPAGIKAEPVDETEIVIPFAQRKTLMQLTDKTCHWPVGDPANPDFFYCGGETYGDLSYCAFHCRVAHQPSRDHHSAKAPYRALGGAAA